MPRFGSIDYAGMDRRYAKAERIKTLKPNQIAAGHQPGVLAPRGVNDPHVIKEPKSYYQLPAGTLAFESIEEAATMYFGKKVYDAQRTKGGPTSTFQASPGIVAHLKAKHEGAIDVLIKGDGAYLIWQKK